MDQQMIGVMIHGAIMSVNKVIEREADSKGRDKTVFYSSASHGKVRHFVSFPVESKPYFSYDSKDATRMKADTANFVVQVLTLCGYKELRVGKAGPTLTVVP